MGEFGSMNLCLGQLTTSQSISRVSCDDEVPASALMTDINSPPTVWTEILHTEGEICFQLGGMISDFLE